MKLTLRTRLLALSLIGLCFVVGVGATGYMATTRLATTADHIVEIGTALKNQMQADQAHDALRADVLAALLAKGARGSAEETAVRGDLEEHRKLFRESIATLEASPLDASARAAVGQVKPALDAYLESAGKIVDLAFQDRAAAEAQYPTFMVAFKHLEKEMAILSDLIERNAKQSETAGQATARSAKAIMVATFLACACVQILLGWYVSRAIVNQLGGEPDEAADLARTVACGDLSAPVRVRPGDTTSLMKQLQDMHASLAKVVFDVRDTADGVAIASAEIAQGNNDLSKRTEDQAMSLERTAASMEELSTTVGQTAENAELAAKLALGASAVAAKGGDVVAQVVDTMRTINDSSKRIADIIGVIDGIAFQTNILALNAAVEAARAGEQGRGFAVVASEVRNLAQRSADAAKEIKQLIATSVERVERGSALVDTAGVTMAEIVQSITRVTDLIGEISQASREQSSGVAQVGDTLQQMDKTTQQNAALVEQSAAAAESLKVQAQNLVRTVAIFRLAEGPVANAPGTKGYAHPLGANAAHDHTGAAAHASPAQGDDDAAWSGEWPRTGT